MPDRLAYICRKDLLSIAELEFQARRCDELNQVVKARLERANSFESEWSDALLKNQNQNLVAAMQDKLIEHISEIKEDEALQERIKAANYFIACDISTKYLKNQIKYAAIAKLCADEVSNKDEKPTAKEVKDHMEELLKAINEEKRAKVTSASVQETLDDTYESFMIRVENYRHKIIDSLLNGQLDAKILLPKDNSLNNSLKNAINALNNYGVTLQNNHVKEGASAIALSQKFHQYADEYNYLLLGRLLETESAKIKHRNGAFLRCLAGIANALIALLACATVIPAIVCAVKGVSIAPFSVFKTKRHELIDQVKTDLENNHTVKAAGNATITVFNM